MIAFYDSPRFLPCGDTGLSVEFADGIDRSVNDKVQRLFRHLQAKSFHGIVDLNPTYRSLYIQYRPWECSFENMLLLVEKALKMPDEDHVRQAAPVRIPVCYGGVHGPDLDVVAAFHGMRTVTDHEPGCYREPDLSTRPLRSQPVISIHGYRPERLIRELRKSLQTVIG